jgi:alpha-1,2-mannosyltransferase
MPPAIHRTIFALAVLACIWFAFHGLMEAIDVNGSDFTIYWDAGRAVLEGRDPRFVHGYIYLPFFALCMAPLALLPYAWAAVVWQAASLAVLVWITRAVVDLVRADGLAARPWLEWAPLVCVLRLADSNFGNGQVNILILALVLLGVRAWVGDHAAGARERSAGAWLGFAAALKILPGFLGVVLVVRRSWRALAVLVATALACVLLVPAIVPGWSANLTQIHGWWLQETRPYLSGGETLFERRSYLPGQSLTPVLYRLLTPTPATALGNAGPRVNLFELEPDEARWIVRGAQIAWLLLLVATLVRSRMRGGAGARMREVSLAICGALTLAPLVHKAHMVWLIVPYAVLLSGTPDAMSTTARRVRWALVLLSVAFVGLTTPAIMGRAIATSLLAHNTIFVGLQLCAAALLVDVWCRRGPAPSSPETSPVDSVSRSRFQPGQVDQVLRPP